MAIAIAAANSARKIVFPKEIPTAPALSNALNSESEKPPSGPIKIDFISPAPCATLCPCAARSSAKTVFFKSRSVNFIGVYISGAVFLFDCSAASIAIFSSFPS